MKIQKAKTAAVAALGLALGMMTTGTSQADSFGAAGNEFTIDFVNVTGANVDDTTGYGAVSYDYRMGQYAISQDAITKATDSGMTNVTAGAWLGNQPAAEISWYEAAAFVNWLNTSTGKTAAYNLTWGGSSWSMTAWTSEQAWQTGGENLYRNKDAYYFLPSEDEWYKAAYYDPNKSGGAGYWRYPTGSDTAPGEVANGTTSGTAVYNNVVFAPAGVNDAGGLSPYGTMGQGGNVWEWSESAYTPPNTNPASDRGLLGGSWDSADNSLQSSNRNFYGPAIYSNSFGFRVASAVPEPSTVGLMLLGGAVYWLVRRKKTTL